VTDGTSRENSREVTRPARARCDCITLAIGRRYERTKKTVGSNLPQNALKVQNEPLESKPTTAQKLAKQHGVSPSTMAGTKEPGADGWHDIRVVVIILLEVDGTMGPAIRQPSAGTDRRGHRAAMIGAPARATRQTALKLCLHRIAPFPGLSAHIGALSAIRRPTLRNTVNCWKASDYEALNIHFATAGKPQKVGILPSLVRG
jgi:hypothetical protein